MTGTLEPFLASEGSISFFYRTVDAASPDSYVLQVLSKYLFRVLSDMLHSYGLSYTVHVEDESDKDHGIFWVDAHAELNNMESVRNLIDEELEKLRGEPPSKQEIESVKEELLLTRARDYESNVDVAMYYISRLDELKANGNLSNQELAIQSVTPEDIHRVVNKYLTKERQLVAWSEPTLTYTQFYVGLGLVIVLIVGIGFYGCRQLVTRRSRVQHPFPRLFIALALLGFGGIATGMLGAGIIAVALWFIIAILHSTAESEAKQLSRNQIIDSARKNSGR